MPVDVIDYHFRDFISDIKRYKNKLLPWWKQNNGYDYSFLRREALLDL